MRAAAAALVLCALVGASLAAPVPAKVDQDRRLIKTGEDVEPVWMTEDEIVAMIRERELAGIFGTGFVDVTDHAPRDLARKAPVRRAFPSSPSQQAVANGLIALMDADNLVSFLTEFSSFLTRYYTTETGRTSHEWLRDYMQKIATSAGRNDTTCSLYAHTGFAQPSVICRIEGEDPALADEIVVCSAHSDSINSANTSGRSPGVDDDGSGVSNFVEVFRAMMAGGFRPKRSIEFIGYAAEEVGLRGSAQIAAAYANTKNVYGVYHNEMSGYPGSERKITILQDYTDRELTSFLQSLVPVYSSLEYQAARCGYGCSDHASWTEEGIPAICTAEAGPFGDVNPRMHTSTDDLSLFDAEYSLEFTKLALGMVVELAQYDP